MSIITDMRSSRRLARYRVLFRASTVAFGAAMFIIGLGVVTLIFAAEPRVLAVGLLLAAMSGLHGYKIAVSTMKIIDAEAGERGWRNLSA